MQMMAHQAHFGDTAPIGVGTLALVLLLSGGCRA